MDRRQLKGSHALVVGLGISGRAAARFLLDSGAHVDAVDDNVEKLKATPEAAALIQRGVTLSSAEPAGPYDIVVVSPGVPPSHPVLSLAARKGWNMVGEIELACRYLPNRMVGVTGTNGKTTVTLMVEHVLRQCGMDARAVGNSGVPLTTLLCREAACAEGETLVVELSSFQLETLSEKCLDAAVVLNITPDHLDRYAGMDEYAAAKMRIRQCLKGGASFYMEEGSARSFGVDGALLYGYDAACAVNTDLVGVYLNGVKAFDLPEHMRGRRSHDIENLMAAYALCSTCGVAGANFVAAFASFRKPAHRIEFVRCCGGVSYIDDSKGTNLDAVIKAVAAMQGPVVLIAGGVDKGAPYTPWIEAFAGKVRCICAIGTAAPKIEADMGRHIPTVVYSSLADAVHAAAAQARSGETVLLSPGCSSFDMFRDYAHRGDEFKRLVQAL